MTSIKSVSVPARVCLAGEDIDWISGKCILSTVDMRMNVNASFSVNSYISIQTKGSMNLQNKLPMNQVGIYTGHFFDCINAAIKIIRDNGAEIKPMNINIESNIPFGAGLASSAVISVAIISCLCELYEIPNDRMMVGKLACLIEIEELQTGAGQMDQYACLLGGTNTIDCTTNPAQLDVSYSLPSDAVFLIVDTMTPRNVKEVITEKRRRYQNKEQGILDYVEKTKQYVSDLSCALTAKKISCEKIGAILTACHNTIRDDMRVSTDLIESAVNICLSHGAYGAKITGTGMGGCFFALTSPDVAPDIKEALIDLPVKAYILDPDYKGLFSKSIHQA